jgi:ribose transport system permease protein
MEDRKFDIQAWLPLVVLAVLIVVVGIFDRGFFSTNKLLTIMADTMTLFLMASGVTFVIMMGGIDLSVQEIASMSSCILAVYISRFGIAAVPLAIFGGLVAGLFSAAMSVWLRIPSFIATLAISGVVLSAGFWFSDTRSVNIPVADREAYLDRIVGDTAGIPNEILVGLVALAALSLLLQMTPFGRIVRGIGAQEQAVIASGVNVNKVKVWAFALSGAMAGLAGVVMGARLGSGSPTLANEFLLPSISAVVVGGTAITGGVGSVWRTLLGALIIQVVRIGMTFIGVSVFAQQIVFGFLLVGAVAITMDRSKVLVVK